MIYMATADGSVRIVILESGNIEEIKKGRPAVTPDKSVMIGWTPDPVWLADKIMDAGGDAAEIARLIEESLKRPEKPGPRPYHKPHTVRFPPPAPGEPTDEATQPPRT